MSPESFARAGWAPLPRPGSIGVQARVLSAEPSLALAELRFAPGATIDEHAADVPVDVYCLEGEGFVSVGDESAALRMGQRVHWPAGVPHRLWTELTSMRTLMVERRGG